MLPEHYKVGALLAVEGHEEGQLIPVVIVDIVDGPDNSKYVHAVWLEAKYKHWPKVGTKGTDFTTRCGPYTKPLTKKQHVRYALAMMGIEFGEDD